MLKERCNGPQEGPSPDYNQWKVSTPEVVPLIEAHFLALILLHITFTEGGGKRFHRWRHLAFPNMSFQIYFL